MDKYIPINRPLKHTVSVRSFRVSGRMGSKKGTVISQLRVAPPIIAPSLSIDVEKVQNGSLSFVGFKGAVLVGLHTTAAKKRAV